MKPNQCEWCGKYAKYEEIDNYTPFGCANPSDPEPYDPTIICAKCSEVLYREYKGRFIEGRYDGDWQKSDAELRAARDCDLIWIGSFSKTINGKRCHNEWVSNI